MLAYIFSALSVARHAVALTLVAGAAATTMVAGSLDERATHQQQPDPTAMPTPALAASVKASTSPTTASSVTTTELAVLVDGCLTKYAAAKSDPSGASAASEACRRAIETSGLSTSDFWARFAPKPTLTTEPRKPTATTEPRKPTADLYDLVKECTTAYAAAKTSTTAANAASLACRRATEASGLSSTEFWSRFGPKDRPTPGPVTPTANVEALVKDCFAKYAAAKSSPTGPAAASEACRRAIEASGLTTTEFWAKFGTPQAPKAEPKTTAAPSSTQLSQLTKYCLTMRASLTSTSSREQVERASAVCAQAIAESKLTPAEFWSKFPKYQ